MDKTKPNISAIAAELGITKDLVQRVIERLSAEGKGSQTANETIHLQEENHAPDNSTLHFESGFFPQDATEDPEHPASNAEEPAVASDPVLLAGRYKDLGLLGRGGMGEVRKVRDTLLHRSLAMKIIHPRLMNHPKFISRFVEEAQVEAQLQHPNIVPVHDIGQLEDGRNYFTMKEIRGTEFTEKIQAVHLASPDDRWRPAEDGTNFRDLIRIHQTVCETIAYAHAEGVIHRDLKPQNIMLGGFGEVLVVDWGLAKLIEREDEEWTSEDEEFLRTDRSENVAHHTQMGNVSGTPYYMAPEQALGQTDVVGKATDVYTLGAILYEILSGQPPYHGDTAMNVLERVKSRPPSRLRDSLHTVDRLSDAEEIAPVFVPRTLKIPRRLIEICESAMQRDIADRTAGAEDLANELRAWLEGDEKREKGLHEVEAARLIADQARGQERKSDDEWRQADSLLTNEGVGSEEAWRLWQASQESEAESRRLWRRYIRQLQGALVHAPDLEEAHYALAVQRVEELIESFALGDRGGQETRTQQLNGHLAQLPSGLRLELIERRDSGLSDTISRHRYRRGALVGRHKQRSSILSQIKEGNRFLTLLGTAGVGKTRLSLELADELRELYTRAVFCDLTEASDELSIAQRLSQALNTRLRDTDPLHHLTDILAEEPTLLVLDNLEQITELIGPMAAKWVKEIESLQILSTSRMKLSAPEEVVVQIHPLSLLEAVDLFVRRARSANTHFELQPEQYPDVCEIVNRLDRLPLALELAAARLNIFSIDELSHRLEERFGILRSRGRDAKALDGALDWSWDMLKPWTKAALTQVSLFRGGFALAAAEGVVDLGEHKRSPEMFDILGELVDNSLLRREQTEDGVVRYSLLESVRAYARTRLLESPGFDPTLCGQDALAAAQLRHATHFSQLGEKSFLKTLNNFNSEARWAELFREFDNLVEGIEQGDTTSAALCCLAALKVLGMKGPVSRGVDLATYVLQLPDLGRREQMLLEIERSKCLRISGRMSEARAMVTGSSRSQGIVKAPPKQSSLQSANQLIEEGDRSFSDDPETAEQSYREALKHYQNAKDLAGASVAYRNIGNIHRIRGDLSAARYEYERAIQNAREAGDLNSESLGLENLAEVLVDEGNFSDALVHQEQAVERIRETTNRQAEAKQLCKLGRVLLKLNRPEQALEALSEAMTTCREAGNREQEGLVLIGQGQALAQLHRETEAEPSLREGISICDNQMPLAAGVARGDLALLLSKQGKLREIRGLLQKAEAQLVRRPLLLAEFLVKQATIQAQQERRDEARKTLERAHSLVHSLPNSSQVVLGQTLQELAKTIDGKPDFNEGSEGHSDPHPSEVEDDEIDVSNDSIPSTRSSASSTDPPIHPPAEDPQLILKAKRLFEVGQVDTNEGKLQSAIDHSMQALELYKSQGQTSEEGLCHTHIGYLYRLTGDPQRAKIHQDTALELALQTNDKTLLAQVYANRALNESAAGNLSSAIGACLEAIRLAEECGNTVQKTVFLGNLGNIYRESGQTQQAIQTLEEALQLAQTTGDKISQSAHLGNLGSVHQEQHNHEKALAYYTRSIALAEEAGDRPTLAVFLGNIGGIHQKEGRHNQAISYFERAISLSIDIGRIATACLHKGNLGNTYKNLGQMELAVKHYKEAIELGKTSDNKRPIGIHLGNLGDAYAQLGRHKEAEEAFLQAIDLTETIMPVAAGAFRGSLALLRAEKGDIKGASYLLKIGEPQIKDHPGEYAKFLCKKGRVHHLENDHNGALKVLRKAAAIAESIHCTPTSEVQLAVKGLKELLEQSP